jgi:hypothetical protein
LGEVRTAADLAADCLDDGRVSVTGEAGAVASVEVNVFGAIDVVDLRSAPVADPDSLRAGDLPARSDAAGQ